MEAVVAMAITGILVAGASFHFRNLFLRQMDLLDQAALLEMGESVIQTLGNNQSCMATFSEHCSDLSIKNEGNCTSSGNVWSPHTQVLANQGATRIGSIVDLSNRVTIIEDRQYSKRFTIQSITLRNLPAAQGGINETGGRGMVAVTITADRAGGQPLSREFTTRVQTEGPLPSPISACLGGYRRIGSIRTYVKTAGASGRTTCLAPGCAAYVATCAPGDLPIAGDCPLDNTQRQEVSADLQLLLTTSVCTGCPTDSARCSAPCRDQDYTGFGCLYYNNTATANSGARILCVRRVDE